MTSTIEVLSNTQRAGQWAVPWCAVSVPSVVKAV